MRLVIPISLMLLVVLSPALCTQIMNGVKPGSATVDLGDGYKASFILGNSEEAYDIDVWEPSVTNARMGSYTTYTFQISPVGDTENSTVARVDLVVPRDSITIDMPEAKTVADCLIEVPATIDDSIGYVLYDVPLFDPAIGINNTAAINNATDVSFHYFPGARKNGEGLEVYADIHVWHQLGNSTRYLPIFQALLDTLHVNGPSIAFQ